MTEEEMSAHEDCSCGQRKERAWRQREAEKGWRQEAAGKRWLKTTDPTAETDLQRWQPWQRRGVNLTLRALAQEHDLPGPPKKTTATHGR
jgi:hypothetical protein